MFKHYLVDNLGDAEKLQDFIERYFGYDSHPVIQLGEYLVEIETSFNGHENGEASYIILKVGEEYYKLYGWTNSYGDSSIEFSNWTTIFRVKPVEKTITVWENI